MIKLHFVQKRQMDRPSGRLIANVIKTEQAKETSEAVDTDVQSIKNNKKRKKSNEMNTSEKIATAEAVLDAMAPEVKVVKKDRGLIERTESSKIILTEDNRQVLND